MTTDLARTGGGALAEFDPHVVDIVRSIVAPDLGDLELAFFLRDCQRRGLDPLARQAYAFRDKRGRIVTIIGIDGLRAIAEQTGQYRGRVLTEFDYGEGWTDRLEPNAQRLVAARVGVAREGYSQPVVATALLTEHAQRTEPWRRMPHVMLAKCAEAQALRAAFPHALSGAYSPDEIEHEQPAATPEADEPIDLGRLRVLGTTVAAIARLQGDSRFDGMSEQAVLDRIVRPKAAQRGEPVTNELVTELVHEAEERYAIMTEQQPSNGSAEAV